MATKKKPVPKKEEPVVEAKPDSQKTFEALLEKLGDPNALLNQYEELMKQNIELKKRNEALEAEQTAASSGKRVVTGKEPDMELPRELPTVVESGESAVFRSPYPGFKQVIKASEVIRHPNGDYHVEPPILAEFTRGVCTLYDPDLIAAMRRKMEAKAKKGEADFIEITDPTLKEDAQKGTRVIKSPEITAETPAESLV